MRQGGGQIVQPVVAGCQYQPFRRAGAQGGLIHFQLDGVQNGLLAHGFHNAAGAQNRQPAFHPDVGVEGAFCNFGAAFDGNDHRKAAGIPGVFGLPLQGFGDHLPGHMVDGGFTHRLVKAGFRHPAHALAAGNVHPGHGRFQCDRRDHRQTGGHVHIVAAVLADGAFRPGIGQAAEDGSHLHHDALGGAQSHRLRRMAGEQPAAPSAAQVPVV